MAKLKVLGAVKFNSMKFSKELSYHLSETSDDRTYLTVKDLRGEIGWFTILLGDKTLEDDIYGRREKKRFEKMQWELKTKVALMKDNNISIIIL